MISLVVATDENDLIGRNNDLPWGRLPADLNHFRKITTGNTVIMGRKTFESLGRKGLKDRVNLVLTNQSDYHIPPSTTNVLLSSIEEVLNANEKFPDKQLFVIGGSQIYNAFLPYVNKIYLTKVMDKFEGDTYFPEVNWLEWDIDSISFAWKDENNRYDCVFMEYTRK